MDAVPGALTRCWRISNYSRLIISAQPSQRGPTPTFAVSDQSDGEFEVCRPSAGVATKVLLVVNPLFRPNSMSSEHLQRERRRWILGQAVRLQHC